MNLEDYAKLDGKRAWFGYVRAFSEKCFFVFKHKLKFQRSVRCKLCATRIPKEVPRISISGSWYYYTGHYCLKCASELIAEDIKNKQTLISHLQGNIADLVSLLKTITAIKKTEKYKDIMSIYILSSKLEPKGVKE